MFGPIVGVVGVQMAAETIKVILGVDGKSRIPALDIDQEDTDSTRLWTLT